MLAAYVNRLGSPEEIRHGELPPPRPRSNEVLVNVCATTVNPVDTFVRSGQYPTTLSFPFVIGRDLVGVVAEAGADASGFAPGDWVWCNSLGHDGRQGAAAEQAVVAADRLYHLPEGVAPTAAVAVVHPAATAWLALFRHGCFRRGETVLVAGAAGNVGSALVVLAAEAGARVLATAARCDLAYTRGLGAAEAFDYADPRLTEHLRSRCPRGIDVHLDTSGRNDLGTAVELLAPRGRIVLLAGARTHPVLPAGALYTKDGSIRGFVISRATTAELGEVAGALNRLLPTGRLRARRTQTLPLPAAAEAHRRMEAGELHGKRLILDIAGATAP
ncbi:NADPH:quinone reductase [Streptomyces pluripotens]|uniref:NADPH:quinone reductase n=1 Tax=Streptomyces pluripotens TaxID=1355015 RepID=A0A221P4D7_9ACTN|nr:MULTISPECIES: NADPH:quinone reductase [Streptomyces]ARP72893.1 oxidoreductase [Streptomyces pluripotens]ASN27143.1 NADPH:quinone reductase [Streptomyces pluripotens]KIE28891.1 oxidoreductase [Streptomyces sp. MUSC 125]MCH0559890.1 NADPH:quinone reductase [Streptomyces sp. MUM 16J]